MLTFTKLYEEIDQLTPNYQLVELEVQFKIISIV